VIPVPWVTKTAIGVFILLSLVGAFFGRDYFLRADRLLVRNVQFEGEFKHVARQQLADAIAEHVKGNVFLLDLDAVKARVESVPWVHRASVRRQWPPAVLIQFSEQKIIAQWGATEWLNSNGELVDLRGPDQPQGLPLLEGPRGAHVQVLSHYAQLSEILKPLHLQIVGLQLSPRRTWRVDLTNGLVLVLGRGSPEEKVTRFAQIYPAIFAKYGGQIKQADFRYTNGFAVQWANPSFSFGRFSPTRTAEVLRPEG